MEFYHIIFLICVILFCLILKKDRRNAKEEKIKGQKEEKEKEDNIFQNALSLVSLPSALTKYIIQQQNDKIFIIGRSGCGKTKLIHYLHSSQNRVLGENRPHMKSLDAQILRTGIEKMKQNTKTTTKGSKDTKEKEETQIINKAKINSVLTLTSLAPNHCSYEVQIANGKKKNFRVSEYPGHEIKWAFVCKELEKNINELALVVILMPNCCFDLFEIKQLHHVLMLIQNKKIGHTKILVIVPVEKKYTPFPKPSEFLSPVSVKNTHKTSNKKTTINWDTADDIETIQNIDLDNLDLDNLDLDREWDLDIGYSTTDEAIDKALDKALDKDQNHGSDVDPMQNAYHKANSMMIEKGLGIDDGMGLGIERVCMENVEDKKIKTDCSPMSSFLSNVKNNSAAAKKATDIQSPISKILIQEKTKELFNKIKNYHVTSLSLGHITLNSNLNFTDLLKQEDSKVAKLGSVLASTSTSASTSASASDSVSVEKGSKPAAEDATLEEIDKKQLEVILNSLITIKFINYNKNNSKEGLEYNAQIQQCIDLALS